MNDKSPKMGMLVSTFFFVLSLSWKHRAVRGSQGFTVVIDRHAGYMQQHRTCRGLVLHHNRNRATLTAFSKPDLATTGKRCKPESLQHGRNDTTVEFALMNTQHESD